jgi:essential nuclear protein 1
VDEGDLRTLDALLPSNAGERRTLADIIFSKLEGAEEEEEKTTAIQKTQRGKLLATCLE